MGLFTQRPEEPSEWAGLPAEPRKRGEGADELSDDPQPPLGSVDLLFGTPSRTVSVEMPLSTTADERSDGGREGDGPAGN